MITNNIDVAKFITEFEKVIPIVDLEHLGKGIRQGHLNSWKSTHKIDDVSRIKNAIPDKTVMVRVNPLNPDSSKEIDEVINRGADVVMLPMFHDIETLARFHDILNGRSLSLPLFETIGSLNVLEEAVTTQPIHALHIGLNDLSLELGFRFMFECFSKNILDVALQSVKNTNIEYGIGGIARVGYGMLPAENILGEHVRLGSSATILSRGFHGNAIDLNELINSIDFALEIAKIQSCYSNWSSVTPSNLAKNKLKTNQIIERIVKNLPRP